jgi:hypothetical protein
MHLANSYCRIGRPLASTPLYGDVAFEHDDPNWLSLKTIITETLLRLPADVYEELMRGEDRPQLQFFGCGGNQLGETIQWRHIVPPNVEPGEYVENTVILLSGELCKECIEKAMATVAHELAHAFLRHYSNHGVPSKSDWSAHRDTKESAANRLAQKWGFRGLRT